MPLDSLHGPSGLCIVICGVLWFVPHFPVSCRACSPPWGLFACASYCLSTCSRLSVQQQCVQQLLRSFPTSILISFNVRCRDANYAAHHIFNTLARFTGRAVCMLERTRHTGTLCSDRRFTADLRVQTQLPYAVKVLLTSSHNIQPAWFGSPRSTSMTLPITGTQKP